jgi:dolichyl-diphosphooligosaccharide--protein glycosyltransferase
MTRRAAAVALLVLLALGLRSLGAPNVFSPDGSIDLRGADSAYHARRALFSFVNFPAVLEWDPYLAYPDGAAVPMPPLYDWAVAGLARLVGDDEAGFERVAAWVSPVASALTVVPVYVAGRLLGGSGLGLGAALLFSVLPVSARTSGVGDLDHNASVALLGAVWLAASLTIASRDVAARPRALAAALAGLARAALLLSWSGSLLYLVLGEGALWLAALVEGRRGMLRAQAAGAGLAALLVTPWLLVADPRAAPGFSTTNLSWFHVATLAAVAAVCAAQWALQPRLAVASFARRALLGLGIALSGAGLLLLAFPDMRAALVPALSFLSKTDTWGQRNMEQQPIFFGSLAGWRGPLGVAHRNYGLLAYAIPLAALAALARARAPAVRGAAVCLACWCGVLGALAMVQVRFGSDFGPSASVGFALLLGAAGRGLHRVLPALPARAIALGLGVALLWPGLSITHLARLRPAVAFIVERGGADADEQLYGARSLVRFAREVRRATPETSGFLDVDGRPEYGILCTPSLGHTLHYMARRATPANNFGPYLDAPKYLAVLRFYQSRSEATALEIADELGVRYVVTHPRRDAGTARFADRLHRWDGSGRRGEPASERLRLVTEGPRGGVIQSDWFEPDVPPGGRVPYKLFERVEGALLEVSGPPGAPVEAQLELATPLGRRLRYRARGTLGSDGRLRLRVPYATEPRAPVRALGPYQLRVGGAPTEVRVSEEAVLRGSVLRVGAGAVGSGDRSS